MYTKGSMKELCLRNSTRPKQWVTATENEPVNLENGLTEKDHGKYKETMEPTRRQMKFGS